MNKRLQAIIKRSKYLEALIGGIPPEMLSFFLDKLQIEISELSGEVTHLKMGQDDEYMNFVTPLEGIEILEYYMAGMDQVPGHEQAQAMDNTTVIHYCNRGQAEVRVQDGRYAYMKPGEFCIEWHQQVGKQFNFYNESYGGLEIIMTLDGISDEDEALLRRFGIDLDLIQEAYDRNDDYFIGRCTDRLQAAFEVLAESIQDGRSEKSTYLISTLYVLNLIRTEAIPKLEQQFYLTKGQRKIVQEIHDRIVQNLEEDISMTELEASYPVSTVSLNKYFEIVYGSTVKRYMQNLRMQEAAKKLVTGTDSIADIALAVGYESQSKFGTVFKRKYGHTPLEYRRLYGGK